jgi:multidrug efflux system membrane fusion protein
LFLPLLLAACGKPAGTPPPTPGAMPPIPAKVAQPLQRQVVEWDEYTGRLQTVEAVELKARVDGYLDKVYVRDGDPVRKGELLFVIDPRPYRAELERAAGALEQAKSRLDLAANDLARAEKLHRSKAISEEEYDARAKAVRESGAAVRTLEATLQAARLNLEFTEVRSPINGKISRELLTPGNLVKADETPLAYIGSADPIHVYLDADERSALKYRRLFPALKRDGKTGIPVELALMDEAGYPHQGVIDYIEPYLNAATGTLKLRGVFPNPDELLIPGFFARVRVPGSLPYPALLLPERAIGSDQGQKFVWIAQDDGAIEYRKVVVGALFGGYRAIAEGLSHEDKVVVEGLQKLRPGARIKAEPTVLSAAGLDSSNAAQP